ncbi:MAG: hypothetical protein QXU03_01700 [Desulfurococcaceae archaeon]
MLYLPVINERKSLFARRDLVDRLMAIANEKGTSLYSLVNDVFESYIKLEELGVNIQSVLEKLLFYDRVRRAGYVLVPRELWDHAVREVYEKGAESHAGRWLSVGARLGKYYRSLDVKDPLNTLVKDLESAFSWLGEVLVHVSDNHLDLVIAGPELTGNLAKLVVEMLKGALEEFEYSFAGTVEAAGVVKVVFEKKVVK